MKKLLSFLLVFSILIPTIWAYNLTDKDKIIVQRASTTIEKMITRKGESYRAKYIVALQKLQLRFQNNPRMHEIIGETTNVLSGDTSGLESIFSNADISVNSPVVNVPKKETTPVVVVPVKNDDQNVVVINQVTLRKCYTENGEGQQTFSNNSWGNCDVVSCSSGYHKEGNSCITNTKSCAITNGVGSQTWNIGTSVWNSCTVASCNTGFIINKDSCITINYPGCNTADITLSNGQVWAACNVGTTAAGTTSISYGNYYQWGSNNTTWTAGWVTDNWAFGGQGPCAIGYHVPTQSQWQAAFSNQSHYLNTTLILPFAGNQSDSDGSLSNQGGIGHYWSSSPDTTLAYSLDFGFGTVNPGGRAPRAYGFSLRCLKN